MELILFCENRTIFTGANSFMDGSRACWAVIGIGSVSIGTIEDLVESSKNANAMVVSFEKNKLIILLPYNLDNPNAIEDPIMSPIME